MYLDGVGGVGGCDTSVCGWLGDRCGCGWDIGVGVSGILVCGCVCGCLGVGGCV